MITRILRALRRTAAEWRATNPQQPLPPRVRSRLKALIDETQVALARIKWHQQPEQIAPKVFDGSGYVAFHRHSDGLPVAIARAAAFVSPPRDCYAAPLANGDVSLYRCTLPELSPTP